MWSYGYEIAEIVPDQKLVTGLISGMGPIHNHKGYIALTDDSILIEGREDDADLTISLSAVHELYIGYDELYTYASVKNLGLLWQPLRIEFYNNGRLEKIYLIIDYMGLYTRNKRWYESLTSILQY
jgi:hypothetical protein